MGVFSFIKISVLVTLKGLPLLRNNQLSFVDLLFFFFSLIHLLISFEMWSAGDCVEKYNDSNGDMKYFVFPTLMEF